MTLFIQLALLGLATGALYAPAAIGFGLVLGQTKIFHIAHGGVFLVAGYTYYYATTIGGLPDLVGLVLTAAASVGCSLLIHFAAYRPLLRRRNASFLVGFVASLGLLTVIANVLVLINGGQFVEFRRTFLSTARVNVSDFYLQAGHIVGFIVALVIVGVLQTFLSLTDAGRAVRAVSADRRLARIYGINVANYDILVVVVAALTLVPSAILIPSLTGLSGGAGLVVGTFAFTATVIGGLGSVIGTFGAALLLGMVENISLFILPGAWQQAFGLGIMVIVLLVRPTGLFVRRSGGPSIAVSGG